MTKPVRLAKRVAEIAGCSRREADQYIQGGWVTVDGEVIDAPQHPITTQTVLVAPDGPVIIDFPQVVSAAGNNAARQMLLRDVNNLTASLGAWANCSSAPNRRASTTPSWCDRSYACCALA